MNGDANGCEDHAPASDPREVSAAPTVSVLLPVRDGAATLPAALRSVLTQTFQDFEILVLDDGSSDDSAQVAAALDDVRIRVVKDGACRGLAARLNQGIDLARGRYVARMDADDLCFPERFARQVEFLDRNRAVSLVGCRAVVFRDSGELEGLFPFAETHEAICAKPWNGFYLVHPTWMGRAEWYRRYRYREPEYVRAEDQELLLRSYNSSRFACLPEVLFAYRQGRFSLDRTLRGRRSILSAQIGQFLRSGHWVFAALAICIAALKVFIDVVAALPGCDFLFIRRMGWALPEEVRLRAEAIVGRR